MALEQVRSSARPFKFAAQLNRLAVWFNKSELYDVLVLVNYANAIRFTIFTQHARAAREALSIAVRLRKKFMLEQ